jgi:hypothetical protein
MATIQQPTLTLTMDDVAALRTFMRSGQSYGDYVRTVMSMSPSQHDIDQIDALTKIGNALTTLMGY